MDLVFEWDAQKAKRNLRKHGITFDEAITVFDDTLASIFNDETSAEEREIMVGYSILNRLLLVCFTERSAGCGLLVRGRPPGRNVTNMKNTSKSNPKRRERAELRPEYRFDYSKALPNRFAGKRRSRSVVVLLDSDVATVFKDAESVNTALRALLTALPLAGNKRRRA